MTITLSSLIMYGHCREQDTSKGAVVVNLNAFLHVFVLGLWGGCVAVEMLLETSARSDPRLRAQVICVDMDL